MSTATLPARRERPESTHRRSSTLLTGDLGLAALLSTCGYAVQTHVARGGGVSFEVRSDRAARRLADDWTAGRIGRNNPRLTPAKRALRERVAALKRDGGSRAIVTPAAPTSR